MNLYNLTESDYFQFQGLVSYICLLLPVYLIPSGKSILTLIIVNPNPNNKLKTGPAIHPEIAISPNPFFEIAIEANLHRMKF